MAGEIDAIVAELNKAFEDFKSKNEQEIKEIKAGIQAAPADLTKVNEALDKLQEAHNAVEAKRAAEAKRLEDLEKKLNRPNLGGDDKVAVERKEFNTVLAANAAERKKAFVPLDETGYVEYKAAQDHYLREGKENLTSEERKVMSVGSDPDGGYFVTPDLSGRIITKVYETTPMRQVASQQTISTDALEGIEDTDEAGAGYAGELAVSANADTPQVGKWSIPVFWIDTEPKATQQLLDDAAVDIEAWLSAKVADKFSRFENAEFVTGAAAKIRGITGYTMAADSGSGVTWGSLGYVATGTSGGFPASNPADKIHDLIGLLKDAYLMNARFMTRRAVVTSIRKFKDGQGNYLWQPSLAAGVPETIAGYPMTRAEDMPAVGADSLSLAFGDFKAGYQIVDRQGIRVLRDPYTAKPYIKLYTTKRVGGGVLNFEAIKFLKFGTS